MANLIKIKNLWLAKVISDDMKPIFCDLEISDGIITNITEKNFETYFQSQEKLGENEYDAKGCIATTPMINFHEHIYSRLAKGLFVKGSMGNFVNILKNLWWKLDRLLDYDMLKASAMMCAIESIKSGTTYIFDHHSSPHATMGSLALISKELSKFGLKGTICFETTDRNGNKLRESALKENYEFISTSSDNNFKGMLGLHASFTLQDGTLKKTSQLLKSLDTGIHIHICEDKSDRLLSKKRFKSFPLDRLIKYELLNHKSILAHGIHLKKKEFRKIAELGSAVVLNPDSNMNNSVGIIRFEKLPENLIVLPGTDGMHSNIKKTLKTIFLLYRHSGKNFENSFKFMKDVYFNQIKFVQNYFSDFSLLKINQKANFVIWDYVPVNNLTSENFWGHFIYTVLERGAKSVLQDGKFLLRDFQIQFDEDSINREIFEQGKKLKEKFESS